MYKKVILCKPMPISEMQIDYDRHGNETGLGTTSEILGDTNRVRYEKIHINGHDYYIFTGKEE